MLFPASFDLSNLDGTNGFVINGVDFDDRSGFSVSSAGDVNGDGIDDAIIGAYRADSNSNGETGESYIIFGTTTGFGSSLDLSSLNGSNGFVINGIDVGDRFGFSVSSAGDVNGDGIDDVIIGAPNADPDSNSRAGESYVVFGSTAGFGSSLELSSLNGSNGFVINGIAVNDRSGFSVSSAGDINGDGFDDVIIGMNRLGYDDNSFAGENYVVFGGTAGFGPSLELSSLNGNNGFVINGIDPYDRSGLSVSSAGDVNGDGIDDVIVSAILADPSGNSVAGESYIVFGSTAGFGSSFELSSLNGSNGFVINGINVEDRSGRSVSSAGDVNGDGFDDVIIGAYVADPNGNIAAGESYVVFGRAAGFGASFDLSSLDGSNGFVISGAAEFDNSGLSVSSAGDVNGDGFDDMIVGARFADPNVKSGAGESYVILGSDRTGFGFSIELSSLNGSDAFVINGIDNGDFSGRSVSGAGDVNGDGFDDVIIGAYTADPNGDDRAGESYVVFGRATGATIFDDALTGTAGEDTIDLLAGNDLYSGGSGNDIISGNDGNDTLFGNDGNDNLFGNDGNDNLFGGFGDDLLIGGSGNDQLGDLNGNDTLIGGTGNDFYTTDGTSDVIVEAANAGIDRIQTTIDYTLDSNVEQLALIQGTAAVNGTGNSLDNRLFGNSADNTLIGLGGTDVFFGRAGDDTLMGGDGDDVMIGEAGDDVLEGGAGRDFLLGGDGSDTFAFTILNGVDIVRDFDTATDILDLTVLFASFGYGGSDPLGDGYLRFGVVGVNTFLQVDADGAGGSNSQLANVAVLREFTDTASLQIGANVLVG